MKRIVSILLVSSLLLSSLAACSRNEPEPEDNQSQPEESVYQDGTYSAAYSVPALDRTLDYLTISILNDEVTIEDYGCREDTSAAASEDTENSSTAEQAGAAAGSSSQATASEQAGSGEASAQSSGTSSEMTEYEAKAAQQMESILEEFEAVGKDVEKMEIIQGAEEHCYRFIRMMRVLLEQAKTGNTEQVTLQKYQDGNYEAIMPDFNAVGWKEYIHATVQDGQITDLTFDALKEEDTSVLITQDPEENPEGEENTPSTYYPQIAQNFLEGGEDLNNIAVPTNGTSATKSFKKLMNALLVSMQSGGPLDVVAPMYVDGTYRAEFADFDEYGWKDYVVLNIKNDVVEIREFDAINEADETKLKSEDSETAAAWEERTGLRPQELTNSLISGFESAGGDVLAVDNIAGATVSTNNFKLLVGQILATSALMGDTENTLEVERMTVEEPDASSSESSSSEAA